MKNFLLNSVIAIVAAFIMVESLSLFWYATIEQSLFYFSTRPEIEILDGSEQESLTRGAIHPYFGYFTGKGNNHRFYSDEAYPFVKEHDKQYVVGVFGGSVALHFGLSGRESFIERMQTHPAFADKEIVILVFAAGGYKQPQQLMMLNYYLAIEQEFDLVVNIDGFNEMALSTQNQARGINPAMPSIDHMQPLLSSIEHSTLTPERLSLLNGIVQQREELQELAEFGQRTPVASGYFLADQLYKIRKSRHQQMVLQFQSEELEEQAESLIYLYPADSSISETRTRDEIAKMWLNSSMMMKTLLESQEIAYVHILQPNQYFSNKMLTAEENEFAYTINHPYGLAIEHGYPALIKQTDHLLEQGVSFYNATPIFDDVQETIYIDNCCHFNQTGNDMLATFVAETVLKNLAD